jgi:hypothetical protein
MHFHGLQRQTKDFEQLKEVMCKAPVLTTPDFTKTFIMECDASGNGIGVVLMQEGRPLDFEIRPLKGKDLQKPIYEKEMMAILHALKKWHPYLIGRNFKVKIDHDSLKYFLEQRLSSKEQQKWVTKILVMILKSSIKRGRKMLWQMYSQERMNMLRPFSVLSRSSNPIG